ncbi:MAG: hypothetical protein L0215_15145, partial [Gemmataceae bacterium]|nr:hypothetical protein [Gemmataceae bacterium]
MSAGESWTLDELKKLIGDVIRPGRFFVSRDLQLTWEAPTEEEIPWELFRGQLLPARFTRETRRFLAWNIYKWENETRSDEPLLSVKLDQERGEIHVVRGILAYVWEPYDTGGNIIESREVTRWTRELVGTLCWQDYSSANDLCRELVELVHQSVIGTSRLPLNSVESPLPVFQLGKLAFLPQRAHCAEPAGDWRDLMELGIRNSAGAFEAFLHSLEGKDLKKVIWKVANLARRGEESPLLLLNQCYQLLNNISLTPYTSFTDNMLSLLRVLVDRGELPLSLYLGFLCSWINLICRHLTAYDLITFHHRGANYPDALVLDVTLNEVLLFAERSPEHFQRDGPSEQELDRRQRRRALLQGCLLRRFYEGLPVPDAPTSPGENARVLPAPYARV